MFNLGNFKYFLFPKKCAFCNNIINYNGKICSECAKKVKMTECFTTTKYITKAVSPFKYEGIIRDSIINVKFVEKNIDVFDTYSNYIEIVFNKYYKNIKFDYVCCIPSDKKTICERGFNTAKEIMNYISKKSNIPKIDNLIYKVKNIEKQHNLNCEKRIENIKGAFNINSNYNIFGKTILLTDDVITTGNTINEAAKMLKLLGAKEIYAISFAMS